MMVHAWLHKYYMQCICTSRQHRKQISVISGVKQKHTALTFKCWISFRLCDLRMAERPEDLNLPTSIVSKIIKVFPHIVSPFNVIVCLRIACPPRARFQRRQMLPSPRWDPKFYHVKFLLNFLKGEHFFQAASVFVLYATSSANSVAQKSNRYSLTSSEVEYNLALNVECNFGFKENHHGIRCGECHDRHGVWQVCEAPRE